MGHVGHGCHPTIVSLQTESTHDSSGGGQAASAPAIVIPAKGRGKKRGKGGRGDQGEKTSPRRSVSGNTDGKLAAVITDVVRGL